jgi:hypothetical protein
MPFIGQACRSYFHDVADLVAKSHAGNVAVFHGRKHGTEKNSAIGILVMRSDHLSDKIGWVMTDLA